MSRFTLPSRFRRPAGCDSAPLDWPQLTLRAAQCLQKRHERSPSLSPRDVAATVTAVLPRAVRRAWRSTLRRLGWLDPAARLTIDLVDGPAWPAVFRGPARELARLAVFGLPGQGGAAEHRHRMAIYDRICGQLIRATHDLPTLQHAARQALSDPDVRNDPALESMVRACISRHEEEVRARLERQRREVNPYAAHPDASYAVSAADSADRKLEVQRRFDRLKSEFDDLVSRYDLIGARERLEKTEALQARHPDVISLAGLEALRVDVSRLAERRELFREQIETLAEQAGLHAWRGADEAAVWILRRLNVMSALYPALLPADELERLRQRVRTCTAAREQDELFAELVKREQSVSAELRTLAEQVHAFHRVARTLPPDDPAFRAAESEYRAAVRAVQSHDKEWLADLMLEFDGLVEEMHDPTGRAHADVDTFLQRVLDELRAVRSEIRAVETERRGDSPAKDNPAPPAAEG